MLLPPNPGPDLLQLDDDVRSSGDHGEPVDPIKLFMVDDLELVTEALAMWLEAKTGVWVLGRCGVDDPQLRQGIARLRPDVISVEIEPLGSATVEVILGLRQAWPAARILVLTATHDARRAVDAARAGAIAWVQKETSAADFLAILRAVARGGACYPPDQLGVVLRELVADRSRGAQVDPRLDLLTSRERGVLQCIVNGMRGSEIATELHMSANTVRTHTNRIFAKLDVHSRLEAITVARAAGMRPTATPMWL